MQRNCKFNWCLNSMTSRMKSYICNLLDSNSGICYCLGLFNILYCSSWRFLQEDPAQIHVVTPLNKTLIGYKTSIPLT